MMWHAPCSSLQPTRRMSLARFWLLMAVGVWEVFSSLVFLIAQVNPRHGVRGLIELLPQLADRHPRGGV